MSMLTITVVILSLSLWSAIYIVHFRYELTTWLRDRFTKAEYPTAQEDGQVSDDPLFRYDRHGDEDD